MFYGRTGFDPIYIIAQIASLQCIFYIALGALLWLLVGPYTGRLPLPYLFNGSWVQVGGWAVWLSNAGSAVIMAVAIAVIVERAKKCLDFSFTAYFIHFAACTLYAGFPKQWQWWVMNAGCLVGTAITSEAICARRELRDIPIACCPFFDWSNFQLKLKQASSHSSQSVNVHQISLKKVAAAGKGGPRRAPQAELTPLNPKGSPAGRSPAKPPKPPSEGQPPKSVIGRLTSKGDLTRLNSSFSSRSEEVV